MCIPTKLQQNIIDRTREGDSIAAFLVDTMQGQHTDAKFNHRLEAAKHLSSTASPTPNAKPPLTVFPAQAGIQRGRAGTKPPFKVPSPLGRGLG